MLFELSMEEELKTIHFSISPVLFGVASRGAERKARGMKPGSCRADEKMFSLKTGKQLSRTMGPAGLYKQYQKLYLINLLSVPVKIQWGR